MSHIISAFLVREFKGWLFRSPGRAAFVGHLTAYICHIGRHFVLPLATVVLHFDLLLSLYLVSQGPGLTIS